MFLPSSDLTNSSIAADTCLVSKNLTLYFVDNIIKIFLLILDISSKVNQYSTSGDLQVTSLLHCPSRGDVVKLS